MPDAREPDRPRSRAGRAVPADELRLPCDPALFPFATTAEVDAPSGPVGQERALEALELGLAVRGAGYDLYVSGLPGTGRRTAVAALVDRVAATLPPACDRLYLPSFADPERPRLLTLPPGKGARYALAVEEVCRGLALRGPTLVEDRGVERKREALAHRYRLEEEERLQRLRERLGHTGIGLVIDESVSPQPFEVVPLHEGQVTSVDRVAADRGAAAAAEVRERLDRGHALLADHLRESRERRRAYDDGLRGVLVEAARVIVDEELRPLTDRYSGPIVDLYLADVRADAVEALVDYAEGGAEAGRRLQARLQRYGVGVVVDRSGDDAAPVVWEETPTRDALFGAIGHPESGPLGPQFDLARIRGGRVLEADGGFLILQATDVVADPEVWEALRQVLRNRLYVPAPGADRGLEPQPVPVDVKVVLIGPPELYDELYRSDPVFRKAFGIRATFAPDMRRDRAALDVYASLVAALAVKAELPPVAADGVAALVELGSVLAGRRDRVTTGYGEVERALREAAYWARRRGAPAVERVDVVQADRARLRRDGAAAERLQELMLDGTLLAATSGAAIGQVNALSVLDRGYTSFGKPTRITASAAPGRAGIINIEREARLSGEIYDKGVLVITGFLRRRYAGLGPLPLTASVTFEQSYAGVDGDSASVAEVVALVSEVAQVPADQALAMTGSISQHGDVQPVRGINEKIRAFYGICRARGLDGAHGVVIPAANVVDLMLPGELVEDARAGRFTVHAVRTIDEALELALGRPLAQIDELVEARLTAFAAALREGPGDVAPTGAAVGPPAAPLAPGVG